LWKFENFLLTLFVKAGRYSCLRVVFLLIEFPLH